MNGEIANTLPHRRIDSALVKACVFRWLNLLETVVNSTVKNTAAAKETNASYVGRVLRLTLLAAAIVEAILDGRQPAEMTLAGLMRRCRYIPVRSTKHIAGSTGCQPHHTLID